MLAIFGRFLLTKVTFEMQGQDYRLPDLLQNTNQEKGVLAFYTN